VTSAYRLVTGGLYPFAVANVAQLKNRELDAAMTVLKLIAASANVRAGIRQMRIVR
jgi:hypothetical protein